MENKKDCILFLHGYTQNSTVFKKRISVLLKEFEKNLSKNPSVFFSSFVLKLIGKFNKALFILKLRFYFVHMGANN